MVPPKSNRIDPWEYDRALYKKRNEIERLFRRGTTKNLKESIDNDSIASICSDALMLASIQPTPDQTLPARSKPATSGPISTKNDTAWTAGIIAAAPKGHKSIPRVERHHGFKRKAGYDDKRERLVADFRELARQLSELKRRTD